MRRIKVKGRSSVMEREKVIHDAAYEEGYQAALREARKELKALKRKVARIKKDAQAAIEAETYRLKQQVEGLKEKLRKAENSREVIIPNLPFELVKNRGGYYKHWSSDNSGDG